MGENAIRRNNCDRTESTFFSKSSKSVIDLRPMELVDAERQEVKNCGHFSIRGYVAEIRKKDRKICWPFSTVLDGHKDLEEQANVLPPLPVSEFRWWGCHNCLKSTNASIGEVADSYNNECKTSVCSSLGNAIISSHGDALLSGFLRASKGNTFEGRKAGPDNTPLSVTAAECDPACSNKKEKEAAAVHPIREADYASKDHDDNAEKNVYHMANGTISGARKVRPCLIVDMVTNESGRFKVSFGTGEQHGCNSSPSGTATASQSVCHNENVSERVPLQSKSNVPIENHRVQQVSNDVFAIRNLKSQGNSFTELCRKEKLGISKSNLNKSNKQHKEVMTDSGKCNVLDVDVYKNNALNAVKSHTSKFHPVELDESDYDSSDENLVRHAIHDQHCTSEKDGSGGTLHQRKIRKVRLLTDILRSEALDASAKDRISDRDAYIDPTMMKAAYSKAEPGCASTGIDRHSDLSTQVERRVLGKRKKRKMPQDEDQDPSQTNWLKCAHDEVVILKGDVETRNIDTAIVNSGSKSYLTKHRNDGKVLLGKKKHKRSHIFDGQSSVAPFQEGMSPEVRVTRRDEAIKNTGDETVPSKSAPDVFPGRGLHLDIKLADAVAQIHDERPILGKKNGKVSQFEDGKSCLMHWQESRSGKDHIIRSYVESKHKGSATLPSKPAGDVLTGGGVSHGLGHMDTHRKAIINKKQNVMPQAEGGGNMPEAPGLGSSLIFQPKASSGTCNCENSAVVQKHQKVPKNQCGKTTNQTSKQAASDDIPMEIVELMAKNQHERRLFSAERTTENAYSGRTEKAKDASTTDFSEILGSEMLRLVHEKSFHLQKVQSTNEGSGIYITGKGVAPKKQKPDCNPFQSNCKYNSINFNMGQAEQSHNTMGFASFSLCREKPSSGFQFAGSGSSINCDKSFSLNEDMVEHRCSPTCLQCLEAYRRSHPQTVSRQSSSRENHHVWSSMVQNSISFGINSPQKLVAESSKVNMLQQSTEPLPRGNINWDRGLSMKPNAIHLQKQGRKVDRDTNKRTNTEYSVLYTEKADEYHPKTLGPLGLYTNETIPAMHLLKLMDEGQKFAKQSPFPYDHSHKDLSGLEVRQSKTNEALVLPPSSDLFDRNSHLVESSEKFPPVLKVNTVGCSFQKRENFKRATGSTGRLSDTLMHNSFKPQGKGKTKTKNQPTKPRLPKSNRSVLEDSSAVENPESASIHDLKKGFQSASNSIPISLHSQARNDSISTRIELEVNKKDKRVWPVMSSCSTEICTLNRNPADFTIPEAGNMYMIEGCDLKHRKGNMSRDKAFLNNQDANKRQRMTKLKAMQTYVQH